jgi:hypothetical protein
MITLFDILLSIRPGAKYTSCNEEIVQWDDEIQPQPTEEEIEEGRKKLEAQWVADEYKRLRKPEYPKIEDQLDLLYHEGIEGWKKIIKETKDKYPKPVVKESEEAPSE